MRSRAYSSDSPVFQRLSVGRQGGRFSRDNDKEQIEQQLQWQASDKLRGELLELVDGNESDLELAIRRADGEPVRTTAEVLNLDPSTVSRRGVRALRQIHSGILGKLICALLRREGGATVSLTNPRPTAADCNTFGISVADSSQAFDSIPDWRQVANWLRKHWSALQVLDDSDRDELRIRYVRAFHDRGRTELDVTVVIRDEITARQFALENGQKAIFHFATSRIIHVN